MYNVQNRQVINEGLHSLACTGLQAPPPNSNNSYLDKLDSNLLSLHLADVVKWLSKNLEMIVKRVVSTKHSWDLPGVIIHCGWIYMHSYWEARDHKVIWLQPSSLIAYEVVCYWISEFISDSHDPRVVFYRMPRPSRSNTGFDSTTITLPYHTLVVILQP